MEVEREKMFYAWEKAEPGEPVGKGNYGTVFKSGEGAVVKVMKQVRKSTGSAKLAYREHVMSLLQSLLVLRRHTPHLPLHYGLEAVRAAPRTLAMRFYLEAFDCSLDGAPSDLLRQPQDWVALLFQVGSALLCVAKLLEVCHNDLYPRNILLRRRPRPCLLSYNHFGLEHELCWHTLAVLTDFGVCSGRLLNSRAGPEVKRTPVVLRSETPFGQQPPGVHVLNHTYLPAFSRDPYLLFKWGRFRTKGLPQPPEAVRSWCSAVLAHLDERQASFSEPAAVLRLFGFAFSPETLQAYGLPSLEPSDSSEKDKEAHFSVDEEDQRKIFQQCTDLLQSVPFSASPASGSSSSS